MRIDVLNTHSQNELLQKKLDQLSKDLKTQEKTVDKYDSEIKQRNDMIVKKQKKVAALNKEYEKHKSSGKDRDENVGPKEAEKNNLRKMCEEKDEEIQGL